MQKAPIPPNDKGRVCALEGLHLLDTASEEGYGTEGAQRLEF